MNLGVIGHLGQELPDPNEVSLYFVTCTQRPKLVQVQSFDIFV